MGILCLLIRRIDYYQESVQFLVGIVVFCLQESQQHSDYLVELEYFLVGILSQQLIDILPAQKYYQADIVALAFVTEDRVLEEQQ